MLGVADCVRDCFRPIIPQPTEWQCPGDEIKAATIFARADFVKVDALSRFDIPLKV